MSILLRHIVKLSLPMLLFLVAIPLGAIPIGGKTDTLSINGNRRFDYFFMEACSQQAQGNYAAAFDLFEHARKINPQAAEVYYNMAPYYMSMGKDSVALASILKAASLNKTIPRPLPPMRNFINKTIATRKS